MNAIYFYSFYRPSEVTDISCYRLLLLRVFWLLREKKKRGRIDFKNKVVFHRTPGKYIWVSQKSRSTNCKVTRKPNSSSLRLNHFPCVSYSALSENLLHSLVW